MKVILVDAYKTFVTDEWINLEMQRMLDKFENKKIILTNADKDKQEKYGLVNLPYEMFTLNANPPKTDSNFYKIFLEKYNLNSDEVIYFEHNLDAINSAKSVWINTYHYDFGKKDLSELERFLIKGI